MYDESDENWRKQNKIVRAMKLHQASFESLI